MGGQGGSGSSVSDAVGCVQRLRVAWQPLAGERRGGSAPPAAEPTMPNASRRPSQASAYLQQGREIRLNAFLECTAPSAQPWRFT